MRIPWWAFGWLLPVLGACAPAGVSAQDFGGSTPLAVSEPADEVTNPPEGPSIPLEVRDLPAGEYVLQAVFTVRGIAKPAVAECEFKGESEGEGQGIMLGPALFGLVVGLVASLAATRIMQSMLFGTKPLDPVVLSAVVATLLAVAILACLIPAWRASRLNPARALRSE